MHYNTKRDTLMMPEYGRHIQNLVEFAMEIEDKEKRQETVLEIIKLMADLNPNSKNVGDYEHKLWDHLFIISNFRLDCDSPYPKPTPEEVYKKPEKFEYPSNKIKFRHYGKNVERMIKKAVEMDDDEKQEAYTELIASFMKRTYSNYNKDGVNDDIIKEDLVRMSDGELSLDDDQRIIVKRSRRSKGNKKNYRKKSSRRPRR